MAIKTTSIRDVFKDKVKSSFAVPTIWVDMDGNEHEDYTSDKVSADNFTIDVTEEFENCVYIKQVGSKVVELGAVVNPQNYVGASLEGRIFILQDDLFDHSFLENAVNLERMFATFYTKGFDLNLDHIIDGLFDNCSKLEDVANVFIECDITKIPENLFAKCPNLKYVDGLFACTNIETIPENLFSANTQIKKAYRTFAFCNKLKERPKNLFKNCIYPVDESELFFKSGPKTIDKLKRVFRK